MNAPLAYLHGRFLPFTEAALPLHDAGFVSGATVVDNARTFRHKLFRWSDHLERFRRDCATCYVPLETSDERLTSIAEELIAHNAKLLPPGGELQLITFATPGPLGYYLGEAASGPATLGMVTYPLPFARYRPFFREGVTLAFLGSTAERNEILPPTVKHRSRMFWHIADRKALMQSINPFALGFPLGPGLTFTETSVANYLAVIDGAVLSPSRDSVLAGISLQVVSELCESMSIPFHEKSCGVADMVKMSEALVTGTAFCLAGVRQPRMGEWPGPLFKKLLAAWSDLVGVDIEKQFTETA